MAFELLHADITEGVLGAFHQVYRDVGYGFLEAVYSNALAVELEYRTLKVRREVPLEVIYRGVLVGRYRADMVVDHVVLVDNKAAKVLTPEMNGNYATASKPRISPCAP